MIFDLTGSPDVVELEVDDLKRLIRNSGAGEPEPEPEIVAEPEPLVPDDILNLYAMEIPESVPVEGWTLEIPMGDMCFWEQLPGRPMRELVLNHEVKQWCDENIRESYWFLGEGIQGATRGYLKDRTAMLYFTLELDYIMFKMRWE